MADNLGEGGPCNEILCTVERNGDYKGEQNNHKEPSQTDQTGPSWTDQIRPSQTDQIEPSQADQIGPSQADQIGPSQTDQKRPSQTDQKGPSQTDQKRPSQTDQKIPSQTDQKGPSQTDQKGPSQTDQKGQQADQNEINQDYQAARERINSNLQKIRLELSEIRNQDVKLLKQLIQINDTIKRLSDDRLSKRRTWYGQRQSICSETSDIYIDMAAFSPDLDEYREAILFRQFSEPTSFSREIYLDPTTSTAIFDASLYLSNGNPRKEPQQNWGMDFSKVPLRHRPYSVSIVNEKSYSMESSQEWQCKNDKSYADLLERSIRLWKSKHSDSQSEDNGERLISLINECLKNNEDEKTNTDQVKLWLKNDTSKNDKSKDVTSKNDMSKDHTSKDHTSKNNTSKDDSNVTTVAADIKTAATETVNPVGDINKEVKPLSRSTGTSFNLCQCSSPPGKPIDNVGKSDMNKENGIYPITDGGSFADEVYHTAERLEKTQDRIVYRNPISIVSSSISKGVCDSVDKANPNNCSLNLSNGEITVFKEGNQPHSTGVGGDCSSHSNNHTSSVVHQQSGVTEFKNIR